MNYVFYVPEQDRIVSTDFSRAIAYFSTSDILPDIEDLIKIYEYGGAVYLGEL